MLRPDSSRTDPPQREEANLPDESSTIGGGELDIQRELNRLEEMLFDSFHIPFTKRTIVDEDIFLSQLDLVRENLPDAFEKAEKIIREREEILIQAEDYAQEIMDGAERRAAQILDEMGIVQRAEMEAARIRQEVQQECEAIHDETMVEIDLLRRQAQQELAKMREQALAEYDDIQNDADDYAEAVLVNLEQQLNDMLRVVRNGRQQLQKEPSPEYPVKETDSGSSGSKK